MLLQWYRLLQEVGDIALQNGVRRQSDRIAKALGFEELINARQSEGRVASEEAPQSIVPVAGDDWLQDIAPIMGAVDVAGPKGTAFQIAELVKHEQWVVAATAKVAVVGRAFLLPVSRTDGAVHVEHDQLRQIAA